ncbi:MAG: NAD-dependent deacylase [Candidatus Viridilinea halotolerans]|uniref:NAD-dependent protein deacylase n=1 Tax=Candidatus Viridilinea halotolerans TaxID=2491704 RepID=A0A426TWV0_9CHLR|nr:MAG: NAD-dependent deacylase [Candidatus Viridilinea halotolerans]
MTSSLPTSLVAALRAARRVAILTGAGVSAESGIPTFRDAQSGLWATYRPEELASPEAFRRNPRLVWEWYAMRRAAVLAAEPNAGHVALAELERLVPTLTLITQNVDGLHARAGSRDPLELHGNITKVRCSVEGTFYATWAEDGDLPPPCPACGAPLRPHVVWFGEQLPTDVLQQAWHAAEACDVFLSIGTSGLVEPAASLPRVAYSHGATVATINLDVRERSEERLFYLHARSGVLLPQLVAQLARA